MNWFQGNIAEAVDSAKTKNAIFVVYVEGDDENTQKLNGFLNERRIREKLETEDFVAIKIEGGSQSYMQFASIYQVVPVPSIFFIGKSGTPLDIGTGALANVDELEEKINKVLAASGKNTPTASASSSVSLISAEQQQATSSATGGDPKSVKSDNNEEIVCEGGVCYKKPKNETAKGTQTTVPDVAENSVSTEEGSHAEARLEETRKLLEQKRRERLQEEQKMEKERELRRRREGKEMHNVQQWQKEHELKELKENIRRERMEEQAVRERIRAQIAADRVERARKFAPETPSIDNNNDAPQQAVSNSHTARLQFRVSNGDTKAHNFVAEDTLSVVRTYVQTELLPGTGIKHFILATTYPKRELTAAQDSQTLAQLALVPSAVILVIGKEGSNPATLIKRSGGLINLLTAVFWAVLSPVYSIFGYLKTMVTRRRDDNAAGAQKRASEEQTAQQDAAKRRNLDRFDTGPSTSRNAPGNEGGEKLGGGGSDQKPYKRYGSSNVHRLSDRNDSDDENATWNGNSTQQQ